MEVHSSSKTSTMNVEPGQTQVIIVRKYIWFHSSRWKLFFFGEILNVLNQEFPIKYVCSFHPKIMQIISIMMANWIITFRNMSTKSVYIILPLVEFWSALCWFYQRWRWWLWSIQRILQIKIQQVCAVCIDFQCFWFCFCNKLI